MLTADGPKTLEFNCRFGDPETQVILPLLKTDLLDIVEACRDQTLAQMNIEWLDSCYAVGVVMASKGYPETSTKGCIISGKHQGLGYIVLNYCCYSMYGGIQTLKQCPTILVLTSIKLHEVNKFK